jgi:hypothetical protein
MGYLYHRACQLFSERRPLGPSELKTGHDMDKVWARGKARVTFAVVMKVLALNIKRFAKARYAERARQQAQNAGIGADRSLGWAC